MKARLLKKILNNTGYLISNHKKYIAVGSTLCHDLINVNKETLIVKYALDTFNEGRWYLQKSSNPELLFIYYKLHELVASGEIHNIINGKDEIENPIKVYTVEDGKLIESLTDVFGFPNVDDNGTVMYDNTHFKTKEEAIIKGVKEYEADINYQSERVKEKEDELQKIKDRIELLKNHIVYLKNLKNECYK